MKPRAYTAPDWSAMISDIHAAGLSTRQIGEACGFQITRHMLRHYDLGVQPLYWRGEAMVVLWMQATGKPREQIPTQVVCTPYRVPQGTRPPVVNVNLPEWPPARQATEMQGKKRGRPSKLADLTRKETA